jgi:hypothetical protein
MVVLLNYLLPIVLIALAFISYKTKKYMPCALIALIFAIIYTVTQPTMHPKGTVPAMPIKQTEFVDKPIVDRTKKVMSIEEREARMDKQEQESKARREQLIKEMDPA